LCPHKNSKFNRKTGQGEEQPMEADTDDRSPSLRQRRASFEPKAAEPKLTQLVPGAAKNENNALAHATAATMKTLTNGMVTKWVGYRMLPPSMETIEVVFRVNSQFVVANELAFIELPKPIKIRLPNQNAISSDASEVETATIKEVNALCVGIDAFAKLKLGETKTLCELDDPKYRSEINAVPRLLSQAVFKQKNKKAWTIHASSFGEFKVDDTTVAETCFETDWKNSKLPQLLKMSAEGEAGLKDYLRPRYYPIILGFMKYALAGFKLKHAAGITYNTFFDLLLKHGGEGPDSLFDARRLLRTDPDCIFIAANLVTEQHKKREFTVLPEVGICRFQFLEAFVRIAVKRFTDEKAGKRVVVGSSDVPVRQAVESLTLMMHFGQSFQKERQDFHSLLFRDECCRIYKDYADVVKAVFDAYRYTLAYPGRQGRFSFKAWVSFLEDSHAADGSFTAGQFGLAFALGKEMVVNETSSWRCMELSHGELMVALGAVVRLRENYDRELFTDQLDEFFNENIREAYQKIIGRHGGPKMMELHDPSLAPMVEFIGRLFQDADDDNSGSINIREFRRCLGQKHICNEMETLGLNISDLDVLFQQLDNDGTGELDLDELCDGFVNMKFQMRGMERAVTYVERCFAEADEDGSGSLSEAEFTSLFSQPSVLRKLDTMGISADDVGELFVQIAGKTCGDQVESVPGPVVGTGGNTCEDITVDKVIAGFLSLRDASKGGTRALAFLRKAFVEADTDGNKALSKEEVKQAFSSPQVRQKLDRLRLRAPDWDTLFDQLDIDGSGDLVWEEISSGMAKYWKQTETNKELRKMKTDILKKSKASSFVAPTSVS